jgi:hypothetical protein
LRCDTIGAQPDKANHYPKSLIRKAVRLNWKNVLRSGTHLAVLLGESGISGTWRLRVPQLGVQQ